MMGERTVMQEALFYSYCIEDHVPADHVAAIYDQSARDPAAAFRVNIGGTATLFDACCALGVSRVVSYWTASAIFDDYDMIRTPTV